MSADVRRHNDRAALATAMADDVVALLLEVPDARIVLTGGTVARDLHQAIAGHDRASAGRRR